jgi:transposase
MAKKRTKYTDQFKRNAVRAMQKRGGRSVGQVAVELGVRTSQLQRWAARQQTPEVDERSKPGDTETLADENRRLRREVERLKMEKAILRKAAALFLKLPK